MKFSCKMIRRKYQKERYLELREETDAGVEERDGIGNFDYIIGAGDATKEESVDGGGPVL